MTTATRLTRLATVGTLALFALVWTPRDAHAQGYISPFIGYNFGGDSGCPAIAACDDKNVNLGVSFGTLGNIFGAEAEVAYIPDFFGDTPLVSSSVLTVMGNFMLAPRIGAVQPYGLVGVGLMKTRVEFVSGLLDLDDNHLGWNVGGGVMGFFGEHVGVRADLRYFHAFQDIELFGINIPETTLDFGRLSGGLVLKF